MTTTTERIDVLAVLARELEIATKFRPSDVREAYAAVAELIEHADTVAHYNKFTAPTDEYVEIPRVTVDKLVAALARVGAP